MKKNNCFCCNIFWVFYYWMYFLEIVVDGQTEVTSAPTLTPVFYNTFGTTQDIILGNEEYSSFASIVQDVAKVYPDVLYNNSNISTVFLPTNEAFFSTMSSTDGYLDSLIQQPEFVAHLYDLLIFHTSYESIELDTLQAPSTMVMLNGETIVLNSYVNATGEMVYTATFETDADTFTDIDTNSTQTVLMEGYDLQSLTARIYPLRAVLLPSFVYTSYNDVLNNESDFSILNELLLLTNPDGLPDDEQYTILAPTDGAFLALGEEVLASLKDPMNVDLLNSILSNHIVSAVVPTVSLEVGDTITSLGGYTLMVSSLEPENITSYNEDDGTTELIEVIAPSFNDGTIEVLAPDILVRNGIIHVIDTVLVVSTATPPPSVGDENNKTIVVTISPSLIQTTIGSSTEDITIPPSDNVSILTSALDNNTIAAVVGDDEDLSILYGALRIANLTEALSETVGLSLLAPTNDGMGSVNPTFFGYLLTPEYILHLQNLLSYHVVTSPFTSSEVPVGETLTPMFNGEIVTFNKNPDTGSITASYRDGNDTLVPVNIIEPDIIASNGIIHKLDGVLLPSFVFNPISKLLSKTTNPSFTILSELLGITFPTGLPQGGSYTLFAPTDEAFSALGEEAIDSLRDPANTDQLNKILANHLSAGVYPTVNLENGQSIPTIGGLDVVVENNGTAVTFNNVNVVSPNLLAFDGIVHAIDSVFIAEESPSDTPSDFIPTTVVPTSELSDVKTPDTPSQPASSIKDQDTPSQPASSGKDQVASGKKPASDLPTQIMHASTNGGSKGSSTNDSNKSLTTVSSTGKSNTNTESGSIKRSKSGKNKGSKSVKSKGSKNGTGKGSKSGKSKEFKSAKGKGSKSGESKGSKFGKGSGMSKRRLK